LLNSKIDSDTAFVGELRSTANISKESVEVFKTNSTNKVKAELSLKAAEYALRAEKSQYFPDVSIVGSYNRSGEWVPNENKFSVGVNVGLTLFNGGRRSAEISAAAHNVEINKLALQQVGNNLDYEIENVWTMALNNQKKTSINEKSVQVSSIQADLLRNLYTLGRSSFQEWDQAETELINSEKQLLMSKKDDAFSLAQIERLQGASLHD
jgi:outer membrane protein TolC